MKNDKGFMKYQKKGVKIAQFPKWLNWIVNLEKKLPDSWKSISVLKLGMGFLTIFLNMKKETLKSLSKNDLSKIRYLVKLIGILNAMKI